jgi:hypothetical protein
VGKLSLSLDDQAVKTGKSSIPGPRSPRGTRGPNPNHDPNCNNLYLYARLAFLAFPRVVLNPSWPFGIIPYESKCPTIHDFWAGRTSPSPLQSLFLNPNSFHPLGATNLVEPLGFGFSAQVRKFSLSLPESSPILALQVAPANTYSTLIS